MTRVYVRNRIIIQKNELRVMVNPNCMSATVLKADISCFENFFPWDWNFSVFLDVETWTLTKIAVNINSPVWNRILRKINVICPYILDSFGSAAERIKASFFWEPWLFGLGFNPHSDRVAPFWIWRFAMVISSGKFTGGSQTSTANFRKWSSHKPVWICPKDSVTVTFSWQEDKVASVS